MEKEKEQNIPTIAIIVPYFGKLPNYFEFWLESCRFNSTIDWFIFTDDKSKYNYPVNVHVSYTKFEDLIELFQNQFDFKIALQTPYKLTDFKPTFGTVFFEYIRKFDFWGFGDIDLIYGNIRSFLSINVLERHDKILTNGPFCLIKNTEENNNVFRNKINGKLKYKEVFSNSNHYGFDEYGNEAFNTICEKSKLRIYKNNLLFADINSWKKHFKLTYVKRTCSNEEVQVLEDEIKEINHSSVFVFNKGKLIRKYLRHGQLKEKEYMYVHFQKRKMAVEPFEVVGKFLMIPNKFVNFKEHIDLDFVLKYGKKKFFSNRRIKRQIYITIRMFFKSKLGI